MIYEGYKLESDGKFGHFEIKPQGKGSVPKELRGSFTKIPFAQQAIDLYLSSKIKEEEEKVAKTKRRSRV